MKQRRRKWTLEYKQAAMERMSSANHAELAQELNIDKSQLYAWRRQLRRLSGVEEEVRPRSGEEKLVRENQRLKAALAERILEVDFFQGALRRIEARRRSGNGSGESASTERSN